MVGKAYVYLNVLAYKVDMMEFIPPVSLSSPSEESADRVNNAFKSPACLAASALSLIFFPIVAISINFSLAPDNNSEAFVDTLDPRFANPSFVADTKFLPLSITSLPALRNPLPKSVTPLPIAEPTFLIPFHASEPKFLAAVPTSFAALTNPLPKFTAPSATADPTPFAPSKSLPPTLPIRSCTV